LRKVASLLMSPKTNFGSPIKRLENQEARKLYGWGGEKNGEDPLHGITFCTRNCPSGEKKILRPPAT